MALDVSTLSRSDKAMAGTGFAALVLSWVLPGWGYSSRAVGGSTWSTAVWNLGASAKLGVLCAALAATLVLVRAAGTRLELPTGPAFMTLALAALGSLLLVFRILDLPTYGHVLGAHWGRRWGMYVVVLLSLLQTAVALLRFQQSGEKAPTITSG